MHEAKVVARRATMAGETSLLWRLEELVDEHGLPEVLDALADMANEKAEHLRTNWQDSRGARGWLRVVPHVRGAAEKARFWLAG